MAKEIKKKKGGQPGNRNALKHGFYAKGIRKLELKELETISEGLEEEIKLMRSIIRRVAENAVDENDRKELIGLLDSIGAAGVRLGSMIRTQKLFYKDQFDKDFDEALDMVWDEINAEKEAEKNGK